MAAVLQLATGAAPANPGAGYVDIYADASDLVHVLTSAGGNTTLATTSIQLVTGNITDANITNAKLANMAEATIKGRAAAAGTGVPVDLTAAELATIMAAYLPGVTDAAWTAMTLSANWVTTGTLYPTSIRTYTPTYAAPGYRKVGGIVYLRGAVNCDSATTTPIATLPAGYRPPIDMFVSAYRGSSTGYGSIPLLIGTDGTLQVPDQNTSYTYFFDGICFPPA